MHSVLFSLGKLHGIEENGTAAKDVHYSAWEMELGGRGTYGGGSTKHSTHGPASMICLVLLWTFFEWRYNMKCLLYMAWWSL
jgi:hypothetical protein